MWRPGFRLVACASILLTCAAAEGDINETWPVAPDLDCSDSTPCSSVHLGRWDRPTCMVRIQARQRQDPLFSDKYASDAEYFQRLPDGTLANSSDQMTLTLKGCETFCGEGTWYWDAIPRLTTWIIPVVLLLSNIELCPIDKHRFMTIVHAVGDPIDSFWSLLHKIYVWRRLHALGVGRSDPRGEDESSWGYRRRRWRRRQERWRRWWLRFLRHWGHRLQRARAALLRRVGLGPGGGDARVNEGGPPDRDELRDDEEFNQPHDHARVVATVLAGLEEISGAYITSETQYTMVLDELGRIGRPDQSPGAWREWRHCARMLADARTNEFMRTLLAIFVYIFGVVAALDDAVGGGNTSRPGGRIGSAVFLMWLVPLALLSNVVGTFTSRRTCLTIMRLFVQRARAAAKSDEAATGGPSPAVGGSFSIPSPAIAVGGGLRLAGGSRLGASSDNVRSGDGPDIGPSGAPGSTGPLTPSSLMFGSGAGVQAVPASFRARHDRRHQRSGSAVAGPSIAGREHVALTDEDAGGISVELQPMQRRQQRQREPGGGSVDLEPLSPDDAIRFSIGSPTAATSLLGNSRGRTGSSPGSQAPLLGPGFRVQRSPEPGAGGIRLLIPITSWAEYFDSLHWLGAVYTYRPWKIGYRSVHGTSHRDYTPNWFLYLLALFPVLVSAVGAFVILWYAVPLGWSCRHVWVVGLTVVWLMSNAFTVWLHSDKIPPREARDGAGVSFNDSWAPGAMPAAGGGTQSTYVPDAGTPQPSPGLRPTPSPRPSPRLGPWSTRASSTEGAAMPDPGDEADLSTQSRHLHPDEDDGSTRANPRSGTPTPSTRPITDYQADPTTDAGRWSERRRWYTMLVKDAVVGIGGLAVVFLSTSGVFNNCWCWSAYMWHRTTRGDWGREAFVPLKSEDEYAQRADVVYWRVVGACLGAQMLFFFCVVALWWDGVSVVRWNETRRRREWRHEVLGAEEEGAPALAGGGLGNIEADDAGYLLFWYSAAELAAQERARHVRRSTFMRMREQRRRSTAAASEGGAGSRRSSGARLLGRNAQRRTQTIQVERGEEIES